MLRPVIACHVSAAGAVLAFQQPPRAAGSYGDCSADDVEREPWRAAVLDQPSDLMPVDVVGDGLSQRPRDPQPAQLPHPPFMYRVMVVDGLVAWSCR